MNPTFAVYQLDKLAASYQKLRILVNKNGEGDDIIIKVITPALSTS